MNMQSTALSFNTHTLAHIHACFPYLQCIDLVLSKTDYLAEAKGTGIPNMGMWYVTVRISHPDESRTSSLFAAWDAGLAACIRPT